MPENQGNDAICYPVYREMKGGKNIHLHVTSTCKRAQLIFGKGEKT